MWSLFLCLPPSLIISKYLQFLIDGKLSAWEVPNMMVKYYTTTQGLKAVR